MAASKKGRVPPRIDLSDLSEAFAASRYGVDLSGAILREGDFGLARDSQARLAGADLRGCRPDGMRGVPAQTDGLVIGPDQAALLISLSGVRVIW